MGLAQHRSHRRKICCAVGFPDRMREFTDMSTALLTRSAAPSATVGPGVDFSRPVRPAQDEPVQAVPRGAPAWRAGVSPVRHHEHLQCQVRLLRLCGGPVRSQAAAQRHAAGGARRDRHLREEPHRLPAVRGRRTAGAPGPARDDPLRRRAGDSPDDLHQWLALDGAEHARSGRGRADQCHHVHRRA